MNETRLRVGQKPVSQVVRLRADECAGEPIPGSAAATVSENIQYEITLLERIARHESDALAELYDRVAPALFGLACRMLNSDTEAEDVLQDVFVRVWEKAVSYDARLGTPIAWLLTLTRNRANDRLRSATRRSRILELLSGREFDQGTTAASPRGSAMARETVTAMQQALKRLPHDQRQAIEMAFLGGLTQSEIAAKLDEPLGTIKARIRRGMHTLRDHLSPEWRDTEAETGMERPQEADRDRLDEAR